MGVFTVTGRLEGHAVERCGDQSSLMIGVLAARNNLQVKNARQPLLKEECWKWAPLTFPDKMQNLEETTQKKLKGTNETVHITKEMEVVKAKLQLETLLLKLLRAGRKNLQVMMKMQVE